METDVAVRLIGFNINSIWLGSRQLKIHTRLGLIITLCQIYNYHVLV